MKITIKREQSPSLLEAMPSVSNLRGAKIIADSGSTKTDWVIMENSQVTCRFSTGGMNPLFRTVDDIRLELGQSMPVFDRNAVKEIFFYGAGIVDDKNGEIIKEAIGVFFPEACIETHSDILGAARALFGHGDGICCILGTGSNVCLYENGIITAKVPPLGFILGDECSGAVLGRKLLGDYFKKIMPAEMRIVFEKEYSPSLAEVLARVYRKEMPNRYLAGFAPFLSKYLNVYPYCRNLLVTSLKEFFDRNVLQISGATGYKLGFVGSAAFFFAECVADVAAMYNFAPPRIVKDPVAGLVEFHK